MTNRHYRSGQLLELSACTGCNSCADICPAATAATDGQLSTPYRMAMLNRLLKSRAGILSKILGRTKLSPDQLKMFSETVFRCTLCGNCEAICPVGIHLKDLWLSLRQDLVASQAFPSKIQMISENLARTHNVFAEDNRERSDWVEFMREVPQNGLIKSKAEVVYYTGCVSSFFPMAQRIPQSVAEIFHAADVDFTILGPDEWCCGFPLLGAGLTDEVQTVMRHNIEAVQRKGADQVVFSCPSCYQMWREYYPTSASLSHTTQFVHDLMLQGHLPLKQLKWTVTYHDPCDLGRGAHIFEQPRDIINTIPGVELVEMERNRENCLCCGGGGNLEMIDPELAAKIAGDKIAAVRATGADTVVTSCQQCVRTMTAYARKNKIRLRVMDIVQLVRKALVL